MTSFGARHPRALYSFLKTGLSANASPPLAGLSSSGNTIYLAFFASSTRPLFKVNAGYKSVLGCTDSMSQYSLVYGPALPPAARSLLPSTTCFPESSGKRPGYPLSPLLRYQVVSGLPCT